MPEISVIITTYNTEKYIAECLDSVLAQTFTAWEAICVDDGCTDNALPIAQNYAKKDSRIRILHTKHNGVCSARNAAISRATGKYIFLLDGDDKIAPEILSVLYNKIKNTKYKLICTEGMLFGDAHGLWHLPKPTKWNMYNWRNGIHNSSIFEKQYWEQFGGYCEQLNNLGLEDYDFFLNFLDAGLKICRIPDRLFWYRIKCSSSRNEYAKTQYHILQQIITTRHPKIRVYKMLSYIKKYLLLIPLFVFRIKTRKPIREIRIFQIPVYRWKIKGEI